MDVIFKEDGSLLQEFVEEADFSESGLYKKSKNKMTGFDGLARVLL